MQQLNACLAFAISTEMEWKKTNNKLMSGSRNLPIKVMHQLKAILAFAISTEME